MKLEVMPLATGVAGVGGIELVGEVMQNVSPIVTLLVQIGIGVATLYRLIFKKKVKTQPIEVGKNLKND